METKLVTPLGEIEVYVEGILAAYEAQPHVCTVRSVLAKPPAGCWRITVPAEACRTIRCAVRLEAPEPQNSGSSGQRYLCAEFVKENVILTIGAENENPAFDTNRLPNGMEYVLKQPLEQVSFGIAWATDYDGKYDIRTYLAADLF